MTRVEAAIRLPHPPATVFAFVADPLSRRRIFPDNFTNVHVASDVQSGPGMRLAFTIVTRDGEFPTETEIQDWNPPHGFTERTVGGDDTALYWSFLPDGDGSRVEVASEYHAKGNLLYRLVERWFSRTALQNSLHIELNRLQEHLAAGEPPAPDGSA